MSLTFRWLGVAGVELRADGQVLALDPFFTRPTLPELLHPLNPNPAISVEKLPECQHVLVTHSHYDHLLDVPDVLRHTGAMAFGSQNTCQLLRLLGIPASQLYELHTGESLSLGLFEVQVIAGRHSWIPFGSVFNGSLPPGLHPPLRAQDYRMDFCLGYSITVMGTRLLVCAAEPRPADVVFSVAQEPRRYYQQLLAGAQPRTFVPIHWDNFTSPVNLPLRRLVRPGRLTLEQLTGLAHHILPGVNVIVPEIFREYAL